MARANFRRPTMPPCPWPLSACALALGMAFAAPAWANPGGASVVAGQANIVSNGNLTTVTNSNGAIINWQSFSIGQNEITRFVQPSAVSRVLNRVVGPDPSSILGRLESNGQVFLINPAGIMVGAGARIDVAGFVASTLALRNEDFLANRLNFTAGANAGLLRNEGAITTADGGRVYLVAPRVENAGSIQAPRGEVLLAAGSSVQIGDTGLPGVRIAVPGEAQTINTGDIAAEAGRIGLFGALVKNSGRLSASSAVADGGRILLKASGTALVEGDGRLEATGTRGGRIEVLGERVGLTDRASLDVSGSAGGGTVLVGGGYQGRDVEVANATVTWMGSNTSIRADALESGDGGQVVVWSDDTTRAYGSISARGGSTGGNGGAIETSGKRYLDVEGIRIDASAPVGRAGNWLLDPEELRVVNNGNPGTDSNVTGSPNFSPVSSATQAVVSTTTLNAAINGNSSVTLATGSGGPLTGDIIFDASQGAILIAKTGNTFSSGLNIQAYRNVIFTGGSTTFRTTAGAGSASLNAYVYAGTGNSVGAANVFVDAGSTVNLDATSTAAVGLHVGNGKTLINNGTVNLGGNSTVYLPTQTDPLTSTSRAATFQNNGTFSNASTAGWFILSNPTNQDGVFDNYGVVNTVGGSVEGIWNNRPGATLNLLGTGTLSLQNAQLMRGTINMPNASGTVQISEYHGTVARFHDTTATGSGSIKVSGSSAAEADFQNFSGASVNLKVGNAGIATVSNGTSRFGAIAVGDNGTLDVLNGATLETAGSVVLGNPLASPVTSGSISVNNGSLDIGGSLIQALGSLSLTNARLRVANPLSVNPSVFSFGGTVTVASDSTLTFDPGTHSSGATQLNLLAGGNLVIDNAIVSAGQLRVEVARNVLIDATAGDAGLVGNNGVNLTLRSADSRLVLGTGAGSGAAIVKTTAADAVIRTHFANRSAGGLFVDATPGLGPGVLGSGFYNGIGLRGSGTVPAVLGTNLFVTYGAIANDVCKVLPGLCVVRPPLVLAPPITPKPVQRRDDDDGLGNFGDDRPKARRPGVCKAA